LNGLPRIDVSIIITAYNYASYIKECIDSCLLQNDSSLNYEVIIVDDGSTDETPLILENYTNKMLRKFRLKNSGIEVASNFGFGKARGKYIVRVDADDKLLPNYLHYMHKNLTNEYDLYYSDYEIINGEGKVISEMNLPEFDVSEIRKRGDFLATGTLYSAEVLKTFCYYSEVVKNSGLENYELILRMLEGGILGKHVPQSLFCYRRHALNISVSKNDQIIRNGSALFQQLGLGVYDTNEYHPYNPPQGLL